MCHDHTIAERDPPSEATEAADREAELERALSGEDGRVFVPPAD